MSYLRGGCKSQCNSRDSSNRLVSNQRASTKTVSPPRDRQPLEGKMRWCHSRLSQTISMVLVCNGKLWYSNINQFCNFDMFRNFVKNSNPMCDVALSMWLLFSLFPRNWQVLRQQRARTSKNTGAPPWQKPETTRTSENRLFLRC